MMTLLLFKMFQTDKDLYFLILVAFTIGFGSCHIASKMKKGDRSSNNNVISLTKMITIHI